MRRLLLIEPLEDRTLPSVTALSPQYLGPPIRILPDEPIVRPEVEPNNSIAEANPLELAATYPYYITAHADAATPLDAPTPAGLSLLPYPWYYDQRLSGAVTGDLSSAVADGDVDFFSFSTEADRKIVVSLTGPAILAGVTPTLLDADGNAVPGVTVGQIGEADDPQAITIEFYTRDAAKFYLQVGPGAGADGSTAYSVQVVVTSDPHNEHEPNDTLADANPLLLQYYPIYYLQDGVQPLATTAEARLAIWYPWYQDRQSGFVSGSLSTSTDVDYYSFWSGDERKISLSLSGLSVGVVELVDADGNVLATSPTTEDNAGWTSVEYYTRVGGQFYVRVSSSDEAAGDYTLNVVVAADPHTEHEPNNTAADANPLQFNYYPWYRYALDVEPVNVAQAMIDVAPAAFWFPWYRDRQSTFVSGNLDSDGGDIAIDYYSFYAAAERKVTLSLSGVNSARGAVLELLDADGNVLAATTALATGEVNIPEYWTSLEHYSRGGGQFYVRISEPDGAAADGPSDYTLHVTVAIDPYVEHESNDSFETANPIQFGPILYYPLARDSANVVLDYPVVYPPQEEFSGYINGQLDSADQDFFSFYSDAGRIVRVTLGTDPTESGGRITLYDANQQELASGATELDWTVTTGGLFYVRLDGATSELRYHLNVTSAEIPDPTEGPDEQEPNDSFDEANYLDLVDWTDLGAGPRTGAVVGIVGGPNGDQDFFQFDVSAGERVHVSLNGLVRDPNLGIFDSLDDLVDAQGIRVRRGNVLDAVLDHFPDLELGAVQVTVYDAAGNVVASSSDEGNALGSVSFVAPDDSSYYAVVSTSTDSLALARYRLNVAALGDPMLPDESAVEETHVEVIHAGEVFTFIDASGDTIRVTLKGRRGTATITLTGGVDDGSDIASVLVEGARGSLIVRTTGSAEVGAVEIEGLLRNSRLLDFGTIRIDGNVGSVTSDTDLGRVIVDGVLGALFAEESTINVLQAETLDTMLAIADAIRRLLVENDVNAAALTELAASEGLVPPLPTPASAPPAQSEAALLAWFTQGG